MIHGSREELQRRIDAIDWYHEFDFGDGLCARAKTPDAESHRRLWQFIRTNLDAIDFTGKTVLDIGCWDGYWSFYAEKRGATRVLATDDSKQNWASNSGLMLAKELLGSSVETNTNLSVYDIAELKTKFDIVLCLGVYYHLIDPFYAFAQIRHCCHDSTIVVFEGDVTMDPYSGAATFNFHDSSQARFRPSPTTLSGMVEAAYFGISSRTYLVPPSGSPKLAGLIQRARRAFYRVAINRIMLVCAPFRGPNGCFWYRPPFRLHCYDTRWS